MTSNAVGFPPDHYGRKILAGREEESRIRAGTSLQGAKPAA